MTPEQQAEIDAVAARVQDALDRADRSREGAMTTLAMEARAAEALCNDHLAWAMRERARRIDAEDRLDVIRKAVGK